MMQAFTFNLLILPSLLIFVSGLLILRLYIKDYRVVLFIATVKTFLFFIYFNIYFDGTYTLLDDWDYINQANTYIDKGYDFFELLLKPYRFVFVFSNKHFLYQLYNVFSFHLFGRYYFSPVALNIMLTYIIGFIVYKLLIQLNMKKKYASSFAVFYLLYWDTLSWSTILNIKDILIQLMSILLIYNIIKFEYNKKYLNLTAIVFLVILFETIRYYLPFLIFTGYMLYKFLFLLYNTKKNRIIYLFIYVFLAIISIFLFSIFFKNEIQLLMLNFVNPVYGIFRFIITPFPFHIEKAYQFLYFSSILNFISLPLLILGIISFSKLLDEKGVIIIFAYISIILLFYGMFAELQGPRHRIQLDPYISTFQFFGLLSLFYKNKLFRLLVKDQ